LAATQPGSGKPSKAQRVPGQSRGQSTYREVRKAPVEHGKVWAALQSWEVA